MWKWLLHPSGRSACTIPSTSLGTDWMSKAAELLDHLDTEEFELLEDVHVEVAPAS
jgi:hypothetical protein